MENSGRIAPKKKSTDRQQISFNLLPAEFPVKKAFTELVGHGQIKDVLLQFMRRYIELEGDIVVLPGSHHRRPEVRESGTGDHATTPQDSHERALVSAILAFDREPGLPEEFREILYVLLRRWLPKSFFNNAGKRSA